MFESHTMTSETSSALRQRATDNTDVALWASPEAKAGMLWLHFDEVHRVAVTGTKPMGRNRALFEQEMVLSST
jgi:hypothetical protein